METALPYRITGAGLVARPRLRYAEVVETNSGDFRMTTSNNVLCGKCRCAAERTTDEGGKTYAVCPACGQRDDLKKAVREAGEHMAYVMQKAFAAKINKTKPRGGLIKISTKAVVRDRTFRWISDYRG